MRLVRTFIDAAAFRGAVVSIGNFDGVHRGHQTMLRALVSKAHECGVPSLVMTFEPHPIALLAPEKAPPSLSTLDRKAELIGRCGVDCLLAYPTNRTLLELSAQEFFDDLIRDHLEATGLVEGPNFHFGKKRSGNVERLRSMCEANGMFLEVMTPVADAATGEMVSSSRIRRAIADGDLGTACEMLGHTYQIRGVVRRGDQRGRTIGFPTANVEDIATLLPAAGVYAARCQIDDTTYAAAVNIGGNPTFDIDEQKVEAHLIGFEGDLYDQGLRIDLVSRLRGVRQFDGPDQLRQQLLRDIADATRAAALES